MSSRFSVYGKQTVASEAKFQLGQACEEAKKEMEKVMSYLTNFADRLADELDIDYDYAMDMIVLAARDMFEPKG